MNDYATDVARAEPRSRGFLLVPRVLRSPRRRDLRRNARGLGLNKGDSYNIANRSPTNGRQPKLTQSSSAGRGAAVRFPPPLIFLIWTLAGVGIHYGVARAPVPVERMISIGVGALIVAIGIGTVASARVHFTRTGQSPIPWKPSPELILQGPYRFTRNPMYVGVTLIQIGLGVAFNNLWIALFALLALATVHFVAVLPEERYLSERFGDRYTSYLTQVRRYL